MVVILGLILTGLLLIGVEVVVPGGVLGVLGVLCLIASCALGYQEYGMFGAIWIFVGDFILVLLTLFIELKFVAKTRFGKRFFLEESDKGHSTRVEQDELLHKKGEVVSRLVPTGMILVEGKQYEAFSQDGVLEIGVEVEVVGKDNFRLVVRKISH